MKNTKKLYLSFFLFVVLFISILSTSCGEVSNSANGEVSNSAKNTNTPPNWIYFYQPPKGKICGVGYAAMHVKGWAYQRATAIARAIDEVARQKGVKVDSKLEHYIEKFADNVRSGLSSYSIQTTNGVNVRAKIVNAYYDKKDSKFYVLMCAY